MQLDTTFVRNEGYTHFSIVIWKRPAISQPEDIMPTKAQIKRQTPVQKKQAWNGLYLIADEAVNKFKHIFQKGLR
jgi:hypothetical protein